MKRIALLLLSTITIIACKSKTDETQTADSTAAIAKDTVATATKPSGEETLCFELKEGKDVTTVKLVMKGDSITGEMEWLPWEKDGAVGTLKGKKVGEEIIVDYEYVIEGSSQMEEKIFKIDGEKLLIKEGELTETKTGKLVLKDASKAKYSETLLKVNCK
jgi:hypothetical protein